MFDIFFRKREKKHKLEKRELYTKIRELKNEKITLKKQIAFHIERYKRIQFLLNSRVAKKSKCFIEQTKKGINVLTAINYSEFEIEIFDLDNIHYNANRSLVLWATRRSDEIIFIKDIQGGNNKGHGELAVNHLIEYSKTLKVKRIEGMISQTDFLHLDRLKSFYKKMKFKADYDNFKENRKIERSL